MSLTANKSLDSLHHTEGEVKKKNFIIFGLDKLEGISCFCIMRSDGC